MKCLLDVNFALACAWSTHKQHSAANRWLDAQKQFATCPGTQMGFLRVSMSAAYGATFAEANTALNAILALSSHRFVEDDTAADDLPSSLASRHDVTDAHFVTLASRHGLKLVSLDEVLCEKEWAQAVAMNPLKNSFSG
jgi:predicted nucleic acid-binding protein